MAEIVFPEDSEAFAQRCRDLDKARDFEALHALIADALTARPDDGALLAEMARAERRLGRPAACRALIQRLAPVFQQAGARIQAHLIFEAEQLEDWPLHQELVNAAAQTKGAGAFMLAAMAQAAVQNGNRGLAAALYEADERTTWIRRYAGRNVLATYPKTGTTWLRFALAEYVRIGAGLGDVGLSVDVNAMLTRAGRAANFVNTHDAAPLANERGDWLDEHRVFVERERLRYDQARVIFLVRDPRDVAVSYYHQLTKRNAAARDLGGMDAFVAHKTRGIPRVLAFYDLIEPVTQRPNALTLYYEDMVADFSSCLRRAVDFLGYGDIGDDAAITQAAAASAFDAMRQLETSGAVWGMQTFGDHSRDHLKVRKGRPGSFAEEVSPEAVARGIEGARRRPKHLLARYNLY